MHGLSIAIRSMTVSTLCHRIRMNRLVRKHRSFTAAAGAEAFRRSARVAYRRTGAVQGPARLFAAPFQGLYRSATWSERTEMSFAFAAEAEDFGATSKDFATEAEDFVLWSEDNAAKSFDFVVRSEDKAAKSEDFSPGSKDNAAKAKDLAVKSEVFSVCPLAAQPPVWATVAFPAFGLAAPAAR